MPAPWRRGVYGSVEYVVVERDGVKEERRQFDGEEAVPVTATTSQSLRGSYTKRQQPSPTRTRSQRDDDDDDDDDYDRPLIPLSTPLLPTSTANAAVASGVPALLITMTLNDVTSTTTGALADSEPAETIIVALPSPKPPQHDRDGKISQTTEHLLIAAGSIGATIIIVMIILALYTMRKRGMTLKDLVQRGKAQARRGPPPPPSKYGLDNKQQFENDYAFARKNSLPPPQLAAINTRTSSFSSRTPLQNLGRSDSFGQRGLDRVSSADKSFYNDSVSCSGPHKRNDSATPSSPLLPVQGQRQSASSRNTRSLDGNEEPLRYSDSPAERALPPAPPTFRQFLSNRPTISQRAPFGNGGGGGIASRFSWTNSNAPQTPHDASRDTVAQPLSRDSFMTSRSSVPRFRTVDSWVNQQSNRVEEQRLKQQFRMTQSSTYSSSSGGDEADADKDKVPALPPLPLLQRKPSGLAGKNIKHARHDTTTSVATAPIFRQHPGTEVRFSTRSTVPSVVLDMGRKNAAL
ncbi:hypothetical protein ACN47E_001902 [Coniothyrium glycines]